MYDGETLRAFVGGSSGSCNRRYGALSATSNSPTAIAADFAGAIDDVRIRGAALSPAAICTRADATSCSVACSGDGGGGGGGDHGEDGKA